jgi:hypothetical protein
MPLRPDLGGFGMFSPMCSPFILCLLDFISRSSWPKRMNADDDSGQNKSFRSKFPSRFLQDALLGFSRSTARCRTHGIGRRCRRDTELLVHSIQRISMHSAPTQTLLQNSKLHLPSRDLPLATLPRVY